MTEQKRGRGRPRKTPQVDPLEAQQPVRGRPTNTMTAAEIATARVQTTPAREDKNEPDRPVRVPMSAGKRLEYTQLDPDYYYRWMSDKDGRLDQAKQAGYSFAVNEQDQQIMRQSGPNRLFLMKLPMKYRIEDEAAKQARVVETLKKENQLANDEYLPEGRKHALQREADDYDPLMDKV